MEKLRESDVLRFKEITPEEKERRGILGVLYGPMASVSVPTRNGRSYSERLWEKVFSNPIVKEMLSKGGIPGELDHPEDRLETCSEKIAIMMPEMPKKDDEGHLVGRFDIVDTPCGRIAYALAKYGFQFGISSRGNGEVIESFTGGPDEVDEDTYDFQAFDLVLLPACEEARLKLVESYGTKATLKSVLKEELDRSSETERKVMLETLSNLDKINEDIKKGESNPLTSTAVDDRADIGKELRESLRKNKLLEQKLRDLQEKISVGYAEGSKKEEELQRYKDATVRLSVKAHGVKALQEKVDRLTEELSAAKKQISSISGQSNTQNERITTLKESITQKDVRIKSMLDEIGALKEQLSQASSSSNVKTQSLQEKLAETRKDSALKSAEYETKLQKASKLVEKYKSVAATAVDKYLQYRALNLGSDVGELKSRLPRNYSFNDVDRICEELQRYKLNISKLPFNVDTTSNKITKMRVKESVETLRSPGNGSDDEIDQQLLNMLK